jgi:hypothetical protein
MVLPAGSTTLDVPAQTRLQTTAPALKGIEGGISMVLPAGSTTLNVPAQTRLQTTAPALSETEGCRYLE